MQISFFELPTCLIKTSQKKRRMIFFSKEKKNFHYMSNKKKEEVFNVYRTTYERGV